MKDRHLIVLYFKSNLNLVILLVSAVLILCVLIFGEGIQRIVLSIGFLGLYLLISIIIFFTRSGAKEIVNEREKDRITKIKEKLNFYRQIRDRISFLRINDQDVKQAIDLFLIVSGDYINKCGELANYSPQANRRLEEVLDVCQVYLERLDQSALSERFNADNKEFRDYKERTIAAIKDASSFIKDKLQGEIIGLTPEERMEIIEEMNKDT
jgi:hypothetical protein